MVIKFGCKVKYIETQTFCNVIQLHTGSNCSWNVLKLWYFIHCNFVLLHKCCWRLTKKSVTIVWLFRRHRTKFVPQMLSDVACWLPCFSRPGSQWLQVSSVKWGPCPGDSGRVFDYACWVSSLATNILRPRTRRSHSRQMNVKMNATVHTHSRLWSVLQH